MARTIQSPGVEINEIDLSLRPVTVEGTSVFVAGFANQGPIDEVLQPTSISEFEQIFGTPTNAAERYFYHTVRQVLNSSTGRVTVSRLPYGENRGDGFDTWRYSALAYPVKSVNTESGSVSSFTLTEILVQDGGSGYVSAPDISITGGILNGTATANMGFDNNETGTLSVTSVSIINAGTYETPPTVEIGSSFVVQTIAVTFSGSGYSQAPTVDFDGDGTGLTAVANIARDGTGTFGVSSITLTDGGQGFSVAPTITLVGSTTGLAASAEATGQDTSAVLAVDGIQNNSQGYITTSTSLTGANAYFIGKPTHVELSSEEYQNIIEGNINWTNNPTVSTEGFTYETLGSAALVVLNKAQTTVNNKFEGYYVGIADNNNFNPATQFNSILSVEGVQSSVSSIRNYTRVPSARLNFTLSATKFGDGSSVSEVMENLSNFDLGESSFQDTLCLGLFKLRQSVFAPDAISLDYVLSESYTGSLDYHRQIADQNGGAARTFFLGRVADGSSNVSVIVNPYISNRYADTWLGNNGIPEKKVRFLTKQLETPLRDAGNFDTQESYVTRVGATSAYVASYAADYGYSDALFPVGVYTNTVSVDKSIGALPQKLDRVLELVDNSDVYPLDIALEAGLGTIYVNALEQSGNPESGSAGAYNDSTALKGVSALYNTSFDGLDAEGTRIRGNYTAVANVLVEMAERKRKDFLVILDPLRNIFVQGENSKNINAKKLWSPNAGVSPDPQADGYVTANFSQHIYWPLRHQFSTINSSYATVYANWAQVVDPQSNRQIWIPFSGFAGAAMANTDSNFQPWFAPAGFTRGVVIGANDLALYPKQKQRDQLYKISLNPVAFFPNEGFVIFGQKTLLKKPSAFDRINVRRLFLNLETATKNTAKFFVFEPNTLFTRTQVINVLSPIFENARNTEGLYDYRIVCSELNNTPDVIDNNELKIDIYIQPVRTAEFILVNFYATRTGTNFDEIIGA